MMNQCSIPPGFRFHPTEEGLLQYYLRKKLAYEKIDLDVIKDVDLNKLEPWDIQEKCKIGSAPQNDWYFFSHKDKKYPTGTRTNRATAAGFWKATGRDKVIYCNSRRIGMRKTLVFYRGRAPRGRKLDWIMHEYRLDNHLIDSLSRSNGCIETETIQEDGWVVCRVFKKRNQHHKREETRVDVMTMATATSMASGWLYSGADGALDQILQYMSRTCKPESGNSLTQLPKFHPLPQFSGDHWPFERQLQYFSNIENTSSSTTTWTNTMATANDRDCSEPMAGDERGREQSLGDWVALDRLVASHLSGQEETSKQSACFNPQLAFFCQTPADIDLHSSALLNPHDSCNDMDLWGFARSSGFPSTSII